MEVLIFLVIVYRAMIAKIIKEKNITCATLKGSQQKERLNVSLSSLPTQIH